MPSVSSTGAAAALAVSVSEAVGAVRQLLCDLDADGGLDDVSRLAEGWPPLDSASLSRGLLELLTPAPAMEATLRRELESDFPDRLARGWRRFAEHELHLVLSDSGSPVLASAEQTAGQLVDDFAGRYAIAIWRREHQARSRAHWTARTDSDGQVMVAAAAHDGGRRAPLEEQLAADEQLAREAAFAAQWEISKVSIRGAWRRCVLAARLAAGLTEDQLNSSLRGPFESWGWGTSRGGPQAAKYWFDAARLLGLDPGLDDGGPLVAAVASTVHAEDMRVPWARFWPALG